MQSVSEFLQFGLVSELALLEFECELLVGEEKLLGLLVRVSLESFESLFECVEVAGVLCIGFLQFVDGLVLK